MSMEMPQPTEAHRRLAAFEGTWEGDEVLHSGPMRPVAARARGRYVFRMGCGGFFLLLDYEETQDGAPLYGGHGVYGHDAKLGAYTAHWFDTMGGWYETAARGVFEGNVLTFALASPRGAARYVYELAGPDEMTFTIHVKGPSGAFEPFMSGRYRRTG